MITQVSAVGAGVIKDPRRKSQSVKFKTSSNIPYKGNKGDEFVKQKNNALWTSFSIVAGSLMFAIGYFLLSARDVAKHVR